MDKKITSAEVREAEREAEVLESQVERMEELVKGFEEGDSKYHRDLREREADLKKEIEDIQASIGKYESWARRMMTARCTGPNFSRTRRSIRKLAEHMEESP